MLLQPHRSCDDVPEFQRIMLGKNLSVMALNAGLKLINEVTMIRSWSLNLDENCTEITKLIDMLEDQMMYKMFIIMAKSVMNMQYAIWLFH